MGGGCGGGGVHLLRDHALRRAGALDALVALLREALCVGPGAGQAAASPVQSRHTKPIRSGERFGKRVFDHFGKRPGGGPDRCTTRRVGRRGPRSSTRCRHRCRRSANRWCCRACSGRRSTGRRLASAPDAMGGESAQPGSSARVHLRVRRGRSFPAGGGGGTLRTPGRRSSSQRPSPT